MIAYKMVSKIRGKVITAKQIMGKADNGQKWQSERNNLILCLISHHRRNCGALTVLTVVL